METFIPRQPGDIVNNNLEEVTEEMTVETAPIAPIAHSLIQKKNRIQVSNTKKPLFFYVNLAKRYIQQHNEVELSALGMAIATVVTVAEILKNNGVATEKSVSTSLIGMKDKNRGQMIQKAKIEIVLGKSEKFGTPAASPRAPAEEPTSKDEM